jgi:hypothetical protein
MGELAVEEFAGLPEGPWPYPEIDISGAISGATETIVLDEEELDALDLEAPAGESRWCPVDYEGRAFCVTYRPVLPFEENFPEFEPPG